MGGVPGVGQRRADRHSVVVHVGTSDVTVGRDGPRSETAGRDGHGDRALSHGSRDSDR